MASREDTPFYFFDQKALEEKIDTLFDVFDDIPVYEPYFPVKINHHPLVLKTAMKKGLGLDVASIRGMRIAIELGCEKILYFCPGKTNDDMVHLLSYSEHVILNIDSSNELEKIGRITNKYKKKIKAIVRIHGKSHSQWQKFGIPLKTLSGFWKTAKKYSYLDLIGIHFHSSRNPNAESYKETIKEIAAYLVGNFSKAQIKEIKYIDFGGGFEVNGTEGYFENFNIKKVIARKGLSIEKYASVISGAIHLYLVPLNPDIKYFSEIGRAIVDSSMHIALRVADVKDRQNVILDGGVNMVGWQRFEYEYFPVINLSHSSSKELRFNRRYSPSACCGDNEHWNCRKYAIMRA